MKTVKLTDLLTDEQIQQCINYYHQCGDGARKMIRDNVIVPNMRQINSKLGQENDPDYLSYAVFIVIDQARKAKAN